MPHYLWLPKRVKSVNGGLLPICGKTHTGPVYLPRVSHIVDLLYTGGFSAVVDASKFFYQFPTHPEDHPYLGLLHPVTGILYYYGGLPMGGGNSPAVAGRFGNSFVRMLKERCALFQGALCHWCGRVR
jgi:hypothetical protein